MLFILMFFACVVFSFLIVADGQVLAALDSWVITLAVPSIWPGINDHSGPSHLCFFLTLHCTVEM